MKTRGTAAAVVILFLWATAVVAQVGPHFTVTASPNPVEYGGDSTVTWSQNLTGGAGCALAVPGRATQNVGNSGWVVVKSIKTSTTVSVMCYDRDGRKAVTKSVVILPGTPDPTPPTACIFGASPVSWVGVVDATDGGDPQYTPSLTLSRVQGNLFTFRASSPGVNGLYVWAKVESGGVALECAVKISVGREVQFTLPPGSGRVLLRVWNYTDIFPRVGSPSTGNFMTLREEGPEVEFEFHPVATSRLQRIPLEVQE